MKLLIILLCLFSQYVYAGITGDTRITGRILKYDDNTVTLSQYGNRKITVPKSAIRKNKKLRTGDVATAVFSAEEIMQKIQEQADKNKKQNQ